jgi:hypothetical protein
MEIAFSCHVQVYLQVGVGLAAAVVVVQRSKRAMYDEKTYMQHQYQGVWPALA